ncbi:MAG: hypothetical protein H6726_32415 [Sandaracinaceae bacterium]|nr:hypothetical protein [Sandaracinaceae bacterium]
MWLSSVTSGASFERGRERIALARVVLGLACASTGLACSAPRPAPPTAAGHTDSLAPASTRAVASPVASASPSSLPTPSRDDAHQGLDERTSNAACGACHATELAQYAQSHHGRGLDNPVFRDEWLPEALPFCADCHAPQGGPGSEGARQAVGCVSCHVDGDTVVRAAGAPTHADVDRALCATCHQFHFPTLAQAPRSAFEPSMWLQATYSEWEQSAAAREGQGCVDCHMPRGAHTWSSGHQPPPLHVTARRASATRLTLELEARAHVGHAVPTGDVFRALVVEVEARDGGGAPITRMLRRRFAGHRGTDGRVVLQAGTDTRVPPPGQGTRRVDLVVPSGPLRARVWALRRAPPGGLSGAAREPRPETNPGARRLLWEGDVP